MVHYFLIYSLLFNALFFILFNALFPRGLLPHEMTIQSIIHFDGSIQMSGGSSANESTIFTEIFKNIKKDPGSHIPIAIDTGSWQFRAGYTNESSPSLIFDPICHRYQSKDDGGASFQIGRNPSITSIARTSSRGPFEDEKFLCHTGTIEHIMDEMFEKLKIQNPHPVIMTEIVANPPIVRKEMSELLFEAYDSPKISYGIDAMFATVNHSSIPLDTALIISVGYGATHILPIVKGKLCHDSIKRINLGGRSASLQMLRIMQCKYPNFPSKMTMWQAEHVMQKTCHFSLDYDKDLQRYGSNLEPDTIVQYPFSTDSIGESHSQSTSSSNLLSPKTILINQEEIKQKRQEQMLKMRERMEKQREEKLKNLQQQVESIKKVKKQIERKMQDEDEENIEEILLENGFESYEEVVEALEDSEEQLKSYLEKRAGEGEEKKPPKYDLLQVPDSELDQVGIKEKRRQKLMKNAADARERIRKEKEIKEEQQRMELERLERERLADPIKWQEKMIKERSELLSKLKARQRKRDALTGGGGGRRSQNSSVRLKNVMSLIEDEPETPKRKSSSLKKFSSSSKKSHSNVSNSSMFDGGRGNGIRERGSRHIEEDQEDTFGMNDSDWSIYRQIKSKQEVNEESSTDEEQLDQNRITEIEEQMEKYCPDLLNSALIKEMSESVTCWDKLRFGPDYLTHIPRTNEQMSQLRINVESIRVPEALYQPSSLVGVDQCGLIEAIEHVLKLFPLEIANAMMQNIQITGGWSLVPNFKDRLEQELIRIRPSNSLINITLQKDPILAPWKGMAKLVQEELSFSSSPSSHSMTPAWIDRQWYFEHGGERLKEMNYFTNSF